MAQHEKVLADKHDTEFHFWDPHGDKREPTSAGWPLTSAGCIPADMHTGKHTHSNKHINNKL